MQKEHIASLSCWCLPERDDDEPTVWVHSLGKPKSIRGFREATWSQLDANWMPKPKFTGGFRGDYEIQPIIHSWPRVPRTPERACATKTGRDIERYQ